MAFEKLHVYSTDVSTFKKIKNKKNLPASSFSKSEEHTFSSIDRDSFLLGVASDLHMDIEGVCASMRGGRGLERCEKKKRLPRNKTHAGMPLN